MNNVACACACYIPKRALLWRLFCCLEKIKNNTQDLIKTKLMSLAGNHKT